MIAVYLRVSTDKQKTEAQKHAVLEYCGIKGYTPLKVYEDNGISAKSLNRPKLQELLRDVESGTITKIVTFELSRLSRNLVDGVNLMETLKKLGVEVETPEGVIDLGEGPGQLVAVIKQWVAQEERLKLSTRVKAGIAAAQAKGVKFGGPRPGAGRPRKVYPPELVEKVRYLLNKGVSIVKTAEMVGVSKSMVQRIKRRA